MENILAMQIVGAITVLIGLRMNVDPVGFNKDIFGDVEGVDSGEMSASRLAIGGGIMALGLLNLYCSMNLDEGTATETVLIGDCDWTCYIFRYHCQCKVPRIHIGNSEASNDSIADSDCNLPLLRYGIGYAD